MSFRAPRLIVDRKIRFAVVGCGRISKNHFESLQKHSDRAELVAVCDPDAQALRAAVETTRAEGYSSLTDLLDRSDADVVVLATPSGIHPSQAIQAAKAGRHVISEKPMATRWEDGKRMVQVADEENVQLFVVKQNRRNTTIQLLKRAIDEGRFGPIHLVNINVFWTRPQSYYDQAKWRGTWEFDGGAFMNQASHYVDLLRWLIGPIESLQAYTATRGRRIETEDTGVVSLRWRSGALGSMNVTMLTYPKNLEGSITILGEHGTARLGGVAVNEIQHWQFKDKQPYDETLKEASYETTSVYGHGHPLYYDNVIRCLRGEEPALTPGREGLQSLETLIAIYRSARDNQRVSFPFDL